MTDIVEGDVTEGEAPATAPRKGLFGRPKKQRPPRPHPYADERSTDAETKWNPRAVTALWFAVSTVLAVVGLYLNGRFSAYAGDSPVLFWDDMNVSILAVGLLLLGLRAWLPDSTGRDDAYGRIAAKVQLERWRPWLGVPGWVIFGFYWALTARDLFVNEDADFVNSTAAILAVYFSTYLAYHEWLNVARRVPNFALQFLRKTMVIAAGTYFAIAYIVPFRVGLIQMVGTQTNWFLNLFGFGSKLGLVFEINKVDILGPVTFYYPDTLGTCPDGTNAVRSSSEAPCLGNYDSAGNWFQDLLYYIPNAEAAAGEHGLKIVMVSIILACTAIQSIMLFVGMFVATPDADWRKKLRFSVGVGIIIYILNLLRNTLVIWAYGRGHTSFWFIHNLVAKVLTLSVLVGIAYICFRGFPEFFRALGTVLDLPQRDGPIERTLRLGKKRPEPESMHESAQAVARNIR